ncbi:MFS multidrug transporter-like protein [Lindgomyces ingoldianus]|uniref:MFS multidrug transporter-like protein n=1 Tax=Lindgomyces ingoldianus TaxID=673940 RepID=A0ACB6R7I5_9PLEO|nr:MFS multidrug transporter-like protein [Lindgomyces ingoldianus]KAF2475209.1 MFS multidrug transporter-like protein [Lindgomyces ingoldianus]
MSGADAIEPNPDRKSGTIPEVEELEKVEVVETPPEPSALSGESDLKEIYPDTLHFALATVALMVAVFLVALDVHILATATPKITTEFDSLLDLTWYGGAYLLTQIALQPTYARLYQVFPIKHIFVTATIILEVGSVIAATSTSSRILIAGRAIQGSGAGGIIAGGLLMINYLIPKPKRPVYLSIIATMYSVAAIAGPVLGGVFAESRVTWRFCFWMNLPIGFITGSMIIFAFPEPKRVATEQPLKKKIMTLDPFGASILISWVTCLLLALQRASIPQPWSYSGIWGPLLAFGILLCIFIILQYYQKDQAIVPVRILTQRTIAACCLFETTVFLATTTIVYYLPFYFQSVKGFSPHKSGIYILPFVVTNSLFAFAGGVAISKTGVYVPFMWGGAALMIIGCGLLFTLNINSPDAHIVGYQLIASIGYGLCVQVPFTAVQILPEKDIPIGNGLMAFFQGLGGALAVSAAQTIFSNALHKHLAEIPNINVDVIISYGATNFVSRIQGNLVHAVRQAYGAATREAFMLPIIGSGLALLATLGVEWRRHHVPKSKDPDEPGVTERRVIITE